MLIVDTLPNHFRTAMCWELLGTVTAATTALNTPHSSDHHRTFYPQRISDLQRTSPVSTHRLSLRRSTLHSSAPMLIGSPSRSTSIRAPHSHTPLQLYQAKVAKQQIEHDEQQLSVCRQLEALHSLLSNDSRLPPIDDYDDKVEHLLITDHSMEHVNAMRTHKFELCVPSSLCIHGQVGTGKTVLMDLFFKSCPQLYDASISILLQSRTRWRGSEARIGSAMARMHRRRYEWHRIRQ